MGKEHSGKLSHHGAMKVLKHMGGVKDADTKYMPVVDREKDAMKKGDKSPYKAYGKYKK